MDRLYVMQLVQSFQLGHISRRLFLRRATAALGSAVAANALLAACAAVPPNAPSPTLSRSEEATATPEAQPTDTPAAEMAEGGAEAEGSLITGMAEYPDREGQDETLTGYLARPGDETPSPAIVVIQEWWGLTDHIKDVTRRFAAEGYVALAPDLYKGAVAGEPDEARKLVMELDMQEAVSEIQQAVVFLQNQEYVSSQKVGIVGFCMGGRLVLMTELAEEDLGAAVSFYGSPLTTEQVPEVKAPLQGHYGTADSGIPVADVETMQTALDEAGIDNEIYVYEGAPHAFFNDTRDSYRPEAATEAWQRTLDWFSTYLG